MPEGNIKVVPAEIGGGFGGKLVVYLEPLALLLSKKTGQPVRLVMTRGRSTARDRPTSGSTIRCKMGATKDGKLVAAEIWMAYEAGAFPGSPVGAGAMTIIAPYDIPNFKIDAYDVVVNRPKTAAYRAPGATNAAMASETIIDELAEKCGIDPCEFRLHQWRAGRRSAYCGSRLRADWLPRNDRGDQKQPPLQIETRRTLPWTRRRFGFLVQHRLAIVSPRQSAK